MIIAGVFLLSFYPGGKMTHRIEEGFYKGCDYPQYFNSGRTPRGMTYTFSFTTIVNAVPACRSSSMVPFS
jgi:hypothetical protein